MRSTLRVVSRCPRRLRNSGCRRDACRLRSAAVCPSRRSALCRSPRPLPVCRSASAQHRADRVGGGPVERHEPLLAALAAHAHDAARQVDVLEVEIDQFAQPQPGRVEQLEDGAIAPARRRCRRRAPPAAGPCRRPADATGSVCSFRGAPTSAVGSSSSSSSRMRYRANVRSAASRRAADDRLLPRSCSSSRNPRTPSTSNARERHRARRGIRRDRRGDRRTARGRSRRPAACAATRSG